MSYRERRELVIHLAKLATMTKPGARPLSVSVRYPPVLPGELQLVGTAGGGGGHPRAPQSGADVYTR